MTRRVRTTAALTFALAAEVLATSCGGEAAIDRAAVFGEVGANVGGPAYGEFAAQTDALSAAAMAFCDDTTDADAFSALRRTFEEAHAAYERTIVFEVAASPVVAAQVPLYVDSFPLTLSSMTSSATVDAMLTGTGTIDLAVASSRVQGFYAVEFVLFELPAQADAMAQFSSDVPGVRRCEYLRALTARLASLADTAALSWTPAGATTFDRALGAAGTAASPYATVGAATADVVVHAYAVLEALADMRLGLALGVAVAGGPVPNPNAAPGYLANITKADILAALDGFRDFYLGERVGDPDARGLQDIVRGRSAAQDTELLARLASARAAVAAIVGDVDAAVAVTTSPEYASVMAAYDALKTLQMTISVGVGPLLGISAAAFQADGD